MIDRIIKKSIVSWLFKGKILIIYGARRTGKTTLAKQIISELGKKSLYLSCDTATVKMALRDPEPDKIKTFFGDNEVVVLDEAQHILNIGLVLKTFCDKFGDVQIIATGSSSFDLANKINEPLTGRAIEFILYPLSVSEYVGAFGMPSYKSNEEMFMRFGMYPEIIGKSEIIATTLLKNIETNYLFKDIFAFEEIRKPQLLHDLLTLLALQLGSEVSPHELAQKLSVSAVTVDRYLDLMEKTFVIKRLRALSRNGRNEVRSNFKVYFIDIGLRNAIIRNFNPLNIRQDIGGIFENFFIMERVKYMNNIGGFMNAYFWRTYDQKEIDYIEESMGTFTGYECKFSRKAHAKDVSTKRFLSLYASSKVYIVHRENYQQFLQSLNL